MTIRLFSASQLSTFSLCNLRWFYRYVENIKSPPGIAATIGKGTHKSVEKNLKAKLTGGNPISIAAAKAIAADATKAYWDAEPPVEDEDSMSQGEAVDQAVALAAVHHQEVAPNIVPVAVEEKHVVDQVPNYDFGLQGYIDIREAAAIRDTKTKGKKQPENAADRGDMADQLTIYSFLSDQFGDVKIDALIKTKKPYAQTITGKPRTSADVDLVFRKFQLMARSIDAGIFHPAPGDSWQCSQKWCGYWGICEFGERKAVTIPVSNLTKVTSTWGE